MATASASLAEAVGAAKAKLLGENPTIVEPQPTVVLKKARKERVCTAKERISRMSPYATGKRSSIYLGVTSQEETVEELTENKSDDLVVSLYQMDLDRALFLLRSYLRIRLQKIEKYMIYISKTNYWNRLSEQEQRFAKRCIDIMEKHLEQSVLSKLPYGYQSMLKQSISSEEDDMVPEPQLNTFVFCKTKSNVGAFQLDDTGEEIVDLVADDLYVLRYKSIKALVDGRRIDLV